MNLKNLTIVVKATSAGFIVLFVLMGTVLFILSPIVELSDVMKLRHQAEENMIVTLQAVAIMYLLSSGIASFVAGYLQKHGSLKDVIYPWFGVLSGLLISISLPLLLVILKMRWLFQLATLWLSDLYINETIFILICGIIGALGGLLGYYADRKYQNELYNNVPLIN